MVRAMKCGGAPTQPTYVHHTTSCLVTCRCWTMSSCRGLWCLTQWERPPPPLPPLHTTFLPFFLLSREQSKKENHTPKSIQSHTTMLSNPHCETCSPPHVLAAHLRRPQWPHWDCNKACSCTLFLNLKKQRSVIILRTSPLGQVRDAAKVTARNCEYAGPPRPS